MKKPELGDVLILKSGGPKMTVSGVETFPKHPKRVAVTCVWHSGGKVQRASFEDVMLRPRTERDAANDVSSALATSIERDRWVSLVQPLLDQLDAVGVIGVSRFNTSVLRALCDSPLAGLTSPTEEP